MSSVANHRDDATRRRPPSRSTRLATVWRDAGGTTENLFESSAVSSRAEAPPGVVREWKYQRRRPAYLPFLGQWAGLDRRQADDKAHVTEIEVHDGVKVLVERTCPNWQR